MFLTLASCMFFLPVISFVHRCLPLAVPVCLQSSISLPSIRWDFLFTWLIPSRYIPAALGSPCASVPGNPASREGFACLSPLGRDHWRHGSLPARLLHPAVPAWGQGLWAKAVGGCRGASPAPLSLCLAFAAELGDFLLPPAAEGHQHLVAFAAQAVNGAGSWPCCEMPVPALCSKALCWSSRLLQGGAAAGAAGAESERFRDGQGNEMVDLRQGERFQNRKRGEGFLCSLLPLELSLV